MTPVYLVRHAKARSRLKWSQPDQLRPLTKKGLGQADALGARLGSRPWSRLMSSPYVRCVQTLEPLARIRDVALETADALAEGAGGGEALELMLSLAADGPLVCCTHADVMLDALEELARAGVRFDGPFECAVASTWILEVSNRVFGSARYVPPPDGGIHA